MTKKRPPVAPNIQYKKYKPWKKSSGSGVGAPVSSGTMPVEANLRLVWPLEPGFVVTQTFEEHEETRQREGYKYYNGGLDLAYPDIREGANVRAAADGVVEKVGHDPKGYGNYVVVNHCNGFETIYAHLLDFACSQGDLINAGDVVGYLGSSGNCHGGPGNPKGTHLHFELRFGGRPVDPGPYMAAG
jgi:murein DD-endopeptidase MepM/ murein hydrolase activator NlpD